jgi:surfactin synthase thioesterase subunit
MIRTLVSVQELAKGDGDQAPTAVLCPFAGGSAYSMREWAPAFPGYRLLGLQYPGRGTRLRDPLAGSIEELVDALLPDLVEALRGVRPVLLGHSMGTCVAVEIIRRLAGSTVSPLALIASAAGPPGQSDAEPLASRLDDEELGRALGEWGGLPPEVLHEPELLSLTIPAVRSDFAIAAEYSCAYRRSDLGLPVVAIGGDCDPVVAADDLAAWSKHTTAASAVRVIPGDHFYYRHATAELRDLLSEHLGPVEVAHHSERTPSGTPDDDSGVRGVVRAAWAGALPGGPLLPSTSFFAAGGSSLAAMRVCARLSADLNVRVPVRLLLEHDRLGEFGDQVELLLGGTR